MAVMETAWEKALEAALKAQPDSKTLTLDGAVKCLHGRLPPPSLFQPFQTLELLSIANVGVSSLENFPKLKNLQRLILSDNRISGGLENLVTAGLDSLRDLDLSNNRIQTVDDLAPLANLRLISLDLYECPVTKIRNYRGIVFGMIRTLKYLDKVDVDGNERPETDDESDDEDEDEDDPGSGEVDGEDRLANGGPGFSGRDAVWDVDEDDESDADDGKPTSNGYARGAPNDESDEEFAEDDEEDVIEAHDNDKTGEGDVVGDDDDDDEEDENGEIGESDARLDLDVEDEYDDEDDDDDDEDDGREFLVQSAGGTVDDDAEDEDDVSEEVDAEPRPSRKRQRVSGEDVVNEGDDVDDDEEDDIVNVARPPDKCT